jgi:hypothetical protein
VDRSLAGIVDHRQSGNRQGGCGDPSHRAGQSRCRADRDAHGRVGAGHRAPTESARGAGTATAARHAGSGSNADTDAKSDAGANANTNTDAATTDADADANSDANANAAAADTNAASYTHADSNAGLDPVTDGDARYNADSWDYSDTGCHANAYSGSASSGSQSLDADASRYR